MQASRPVCFFSENNTDLRSSRVRTLVISLFRATYVLGAVFLLQSSGHAEFTYNPDASGTDLSQSENGEGSTDALGAWYERAEGEFSGSFGPYGVSASGNCHAYAGASVFAYADMVTAGASMSGSATSEFDWSGSPGGADPVDFHVSIHVTGFISAEGVSWYNPLFFQYSTSSSGAYANGTASASDTSAGGGARAAGGGLGGDDNYGTLEGDEDVTISNQSNCGAEGDFGYAHYWAYSDYEISMSNDYTTTGGESVLTATVKLEAGAFASAAEYGTSDGQITMYAHGNAEAAISGTAYLSMTP